MSRVFERSAINGMELTNRFVRSATWEGMAGDDGQENVRRTVGPGSSLLPVSEGRGVESELGDECGLTQAEASAEGSNVDDGHFHFGERNRNVFPFGPGNSFLHSLHIRWNPKRVKNCLQELKLAYILC